MIPAMIAAGVTLLGLLWTGWHEANIVEREAVVQLEVQAAQARASFRLEAARVVMSEPTCKRALARAAQLRAIFADDLGPDFATSFKLSFGRYRFDPKTESFIPLRDPTGCTDARPIHVADLSAETIDALLNLRRSVIELRPLPSLESR